MIRSIRGRGRGVEAWCEGGCVELAGAVAVTWSKMADSGARGYPTLHSLTSSSLLGSLRPSGEPLTVDPKMLPLNW